MKKSTAIIILIIGILIISMCNFDEVKEAFELNIITTTIQSKLINKDNKYIKADLKIPQLTMGNKSIENNLNKKFETDIMSFYNNSYKEAQSFFDDFPEAENKFIVSSDYEVKKSNDDILSILIKYYKYSGGAHGIYEYVPYNIDLTSGNTFVLNDIVKHHLFYDSKSILQEIVQSLGKELEYREISQTGPQHNKTFTVECVCNGYFNVQAVGPTKKKAQQSAAYNAILLLKEKGVFSDESEK